MSHKNDSDSGAPDYVPKAVVARLSLYLRQLQQLETDDEDTISSTRLGQALGISDTQVRKDFGYFGQFGYPGVGYRCRELITNIREILGTNRIWPVALVGAGHMGQALLGYRGFGKQGFELAAAFDVATDLIGQTIGELVIQDFEEFNATIAAQEIRLAILSVPAEVAQPVAERLVSAGICGILNFAPVKLNLGDSTIVVDVDLAIQLEQLSFGVAKCSEKQ